MSYNIIISPKTGNAVSIYGKEGNSIINSYLNYLIRKEPVSQLGGDARLTDDVCDGGHVLNNPWRTSMFIKRIEELKIYKDQCDVSGGAPPEYDNLLKEAVHVQSDATPAVKRFWAQLIRVLISMCPRGKMKLHKQLTNETIYSSDVYTVEKFNSEIGGGTGEEEHTDLISNYHVLTSPREKLINYPFKTIYDQVTKMQTELTSLENKFADDPTLSAISTADTEEELSLMRKLKEHLEEWAQYIAKVGAREEDMYGTLEIHTT